MKKMKRTIGALFGGALTCAVIAVQAKPADTWQDQLANGDSPKAVAAKLPTESLTDIQALNALRLRLKTNNKEIVAQAFFAALASRKPTDPVLLNLSLTYVDQMMGKNLLQQGNLSTRSQDAAEQIIKHNAQDWTAWYIRGINNLYWPDWFGKASLARDYLTEAIAIHERLSPVEKDSNDKYALGYLALGDAYALLDNLAEARKTWQKGLRIYPYFTKLRERLSVADGDQHTVVRAARDPNKPIDTDLAFLWSPGSSSFRVTLTGGHLYGPGPLDDQPLNPGSLANLYLAGTLTGHIPAFNNGAAEPNLPGEVLQGKTIDGLLSDGTKANEYVDVGFVSLMKGKFNLFLAAVQNGPNKGNINLFLDEGWHWTILDDIGIDPGFPVGVVKINDFTFSTSPRVIPYSRQTEAGAPAGVDQAGSIVSGGVVPGALGDANFDGRLDGTLNAVGRFPFDSVILPGAPFAQTRVFDTDIPVTSAQAALLTVANALSYLSLALDRQDKEPDLAAWLRKTFNERMDTARHHAEQASLPDKAMQMLSLLQANAGATELCSGWKMLQEIAPANDLRRRDFNASGIKIMCEK
jgi:tetratricopeptide (TPR) repeat protein